MERTSSNGNQSFICHCRTSHRFCFSHNLSSTPLAFTTILLVNDSSTCTIFLCIRLFRFCINLQRTSRLFFTYKTSCYYVNGIFSYKNEASLYRLLEQLVYRTRYYFTTESITNFNRKFLAIIHCCRKLNLWISKSDKNKYTPPI